MKIKQEHYEHLEALIKPLDTPLAREYAIRQEFTNKRYRWDLLWQAKTSQWIVDNLYKYMHDGHIDTALRSIVPNLTNKEEQI